MSKTIPLQAEQEKELIDFFRENPSLWNTKHSDYNNRNMRNDKLEEIAHRLGLNRKDAYEKYRNLRTTFFREHKRVTQAQAPDRIPFVSKWRHYHNMLFLSKDSANNNNSNNISNESSSASDRSGLIELSNGGVSIVRNAHILSNHLNNNNNSAVVDDDSAASFCQILQSDGNDSGAKKHAIAHSEEVAAAIAAAGTVTTSVNKQMLVQMASGSNNQVLALQSNGSNNVYLVQPQSSGSNENHDVPQQHLLVLPNVNLMALNKHTYSKNPTPTINGGSCASSAVINATVSSASSSSSSNVQMHTTPNGNVSFVAATGTQQRSVITGRTLPSVVHFTSTAVCNNNNTTSIRKSASNDAGQQQQTTVVVGPKSMSLGVNSTPKLEDEVGSGQHLVTCSLAATVTPMGNIKVNGTLANGTPFLSRQASSGSKSVAPTGPLTSTPIVSQQHLAHRTKHGSGGSVSSVASNLSAGTFNFAPILTLPSSAVVSPQLVVNSNAPNCHHRTGGVTTIQLATPLSSSFSSTTSPAASSFSLPVTALTNAAAASAVGPGTPASTTTNTPAVSWNDVREMVRTLVTETIAKEMADDEESAFCRSLAASLRAMERSRKEKAKLELQRVMVNMLVDGCKTSDNVLGGQHDHHHQEEDEESNTTPSGRSPSIRASTLSVIKNNMTSSSNAAAHIETSSAAPIAARRSRSSTSSSNGNLQTYMLQPSSSSAKSSFLASMVPGAASSPVSTISLRPRRSETLGSGEESDSATGPTAVVFTMKRTRSGHSPNKTHGTGMVGLNANKMIKTDK